MPPDDRTAGFDELMDPGLDLPFDAALESLHAELLEAGAQARRMLYGRSQPTRLFTNALRARLLGRIDSPALASAVAGAASNTEATFSAPPMDAGNEREWEIVTSGETRAPAGARQRQARPSVAIPLRIVLALLATAALLVVAALGGSFEALLPA